MPGEEPVSRTARPLQAAGLSLAAGLYAAFCGIESFWPALLWLASLVFFLAAARGLEPLPRMRPRPAALLLLGAALLPVLVRVLHMDPSRLHGDEFIVGYFSATRDFAHASFFAPVPDRFEWVSQFPAPFFFLQRLFLGLFGATTLTLRLSVQVYVAAVSVMVFLIASEVLDRKAAAAAVVLYSFMAVSVYLETLGLMFVACAAVFSAFFYLVLRARRTGRTFDAALAGVACGFCYLTYYTGYIALPLLALVLLSRFLGGKPKRELQNLLVAVAGAVIVVAPYLAWTLASGDSYLRRTADVTLLDGARSPFREAVAGGASPVPIVRDNLVLSLRAFVVDGIGGQFGFDFGRLAMCDRLSFALLLGGFAAGCVLAFRGRPELLFVCLAVAAVFVGGVVLTIPPPAYHRLSMVFPLLAVLSAVPFWLLLRIPRLPERAGLALAGALLLWYVSANERQLAEALYRDKPSDEFRLADLLLTRFSDRGLSIAGWPNHALQKVLFFRDEERHRNIRPVFVRETLQALDRSRRYAYAVTFGDRDRRKFEEADPKGRFYRVSHFYGIFAN